MNFSSIDLSENLLTAPDAAGVVAHGSREAAVLVPILDWPRSPKLIFTERHADLKKHAGEISFPGGLSEESDPDLEWTALRETHEEISISPDRVEVSGALAPVGTFVTSFRIQPFVGVVSGDQPLVANPSEVAAILQFGIDELVDAYAMRRLVRRGVPIRTPTFEMNRVMIWGATARILTDFLIRIRALT